jgi:transcriptional regulator with XRE-family HTH domain
VNSFTQRRSCVQQMQAAAWRWQVLARSESADRRKGARQWLRDAFLRAVYPRPGRIAGDRVPRLPPLARLLPTLTGTRAAWPAVETVPSACRECGRALPRSPTASRRQAFCSLSRAATNRAARALRTLSPDQTRLRAAIADRGLTLTDVANACGVTRGAVGQWFIDGPNGRPIPERHMATIRGLLGGSERGTLYAAENGFAGEPELQQVIDALRTAVRRHNSSFYK